MTDGINPNPSLNKYNNQTEYLLAFICVVLFVLMLLGLAALLQTGLFSAVAAAWFANTFPPIASWLGTSIIGTLGINGTLIATGTAAWLLAAFGAEFAQKGTWKGKFKQLKGEIQEKSIGLDRFADMWSQHEESNTTLSNGEQEKHTVGNYLAFEFNVYKTWRGRRNTHSSKTFIPIHCIAPLYMVVMLANDLITLVFAILTLGQFKPSFRAEVTEKTSFKQLAALLVGNLIMGMLLTVESVINPFAVILSAYQAIKNVLFAVLDFISPIFGEGTGGNSPLFVQTLKGVLILPLFLAIEVPFTFLAKSVQIMWRGVWHILESMGPEKGAEKRRDNQYNSAVQSSTLSNSTASPTPPDTPSPVSAVNEQLNGQNSASAN